MGEPDPPAAEVCDPCSACEGPGLTQEALDPTAIVEIEAPDNQWRRDERDEAAVQRGL